MNVPVIPIPGASALWRHWQQVGCRLTHLNSVDFSQQSRDKDNNAGRTFGSSELTQVFYEAPHRVKETIADIAETLGIKRQIVIARELTKVHEQFLRGTAAEIAERVRFA